MSLEEIMTDISEADQNQYLTLDISDEELAVPVSNIREIIRHSKLTKMPMVPNFVEGVINLRGHVVPVINLAVKFGFDVKEKSPRTCIIIMDIAFNNDNSAVMGVMVDQVLQVIDIPDNDIEASPSLGGKIQTGFIKGMAKTEDGFIIILDVNQIFSAEEAEMINGMHEDAD